jgi:tight adherence protein C
MGSVGIAAGMALVIGGIAAVLYAGWRSSARSGAMAYLTEEGSSAPESIGPAIPSFAERVVRPFGHAFAAKVRELYPSQRLDRLHQQLLYAGLSNTLRAEELATIQVVLAGAALLGGIAFSVLAGGSIRVKLVLIVVLAVSGILGPPAWLARKVRERTNSIERDLPDVLDLLTIAVEAGLGLEQAMETACADFVSPMAEELARTLQEMSLGLSRQRALENMKDRSESQDLASFVAGLTQADSLGMPIGRVLRSQADEMRARRRARAREQAAKLPVKILFPVIFFILPPLMIVVVGPAAAGIARILHI